MHYRFLLATALAGLAASAFAAEQTVERNLDAVRATQASQQANLLRSRHLSGSNSSAMPSALGEGVGGENGPYANPYRTYPPSCMADPLPAEPTGPTWEARIGLSAWNQSLGGYVRENVDIIFWRVACSSDAYAKSITLMRIERDPGFEGDVNQYILFPGVRVAQGSVGFDDPDAFDVPRTAVEPNTIITNVAVDAPMVYSTTYVLEDYPFPNRPAFDYGLAFDIRLDNFINDGQPRQYIFELPDYVPTQSSYPSAFEPIFINGYLSTGWYTPQHSGEGIYTNVLDIGGSYLMVMTWYTYGPDGEAYWLTGSAEAPPGSRSVTVPMYYRDNGGFAGNFGDSTDAHEWGSVTAEFSDCNHMQFSFQSNGGLPSTVPAGSGSREWVRVGNINGLTCE